MPKVCPQCHIAFDDGLEACPRHAAGSSGEAASGGGAAGDPLIGALLAGRYRVLRTLGEGGMGRVYLAEHVKMGRKSAVKVMNPALAPTAEAISRFNREAANASRINQPNVAAIYDFGETDEGVLYLAMEYVEGETLSALLRREGPLAPARAAELTAQVADGVHAAHHLGIVHRDLKPDNVLVTRLHDGREWAKVVDFGIAKTTQGADQTVTSFGISVGTPEYMSPEQLAGESVDGRTDVYSLGLVLFTMLAGTLPHPAVASKQALVQRLTARPRTLAEVRPDVAWPARLQVAIDRALAPEPADRYPSVDELARVVRAAVGGGSSAAPGRATTQAPGAAAAPPRPARRSGRGVLVTALLLISAAGAVALRPPEALRPLLARAGRRPAPPVAPAPAPTDDSAAAVVTPAGMPLASEPAPVRLPGDSVGGSGDSAGVAAVPIQSAEVDAREVLVHVARARELSRTRQLKGAGLELRTAYEEYRIFLTEHAAAPQLEMLRRELQSAMDEALDACRAARDSSAAHGGASFRCEHPAKTGVLMTESDDVAQPPRVP